MVHVDMGYWALVGMNLGRAITTAMLLIVITRWRPLWAFSMQSFHSLFSFGSKLLVAGLVATIGQNLYAVLIGKRFSVDQLGYFQQGYNYTNMLSGTLSSVVQGVTYPIMTSVKTDTGRLVGIYSKVMGVVTFITIPIFVGFASVSEEFVLIFLGEKWLPMVPVLIVLSLARMITPISSLNMSILNATGRSDLFLKIDLSKLPMVLVFLVIALPYGIVAVAISQLVAVFISFFINAYYPGRLYGFGAKEQIKELLPILLASSIMAFCIYWIEFESMVLQFLLKIGVGSLIYIGLSWLFNIAALVNIVGIIKERFKIFV